MSKNWHPPYSEEFKARMVELFRAGRTPAELAEEFEPSSESIRQPISTRGGVRTA